LSTAATQDASHNSHNSHDNHDAGHAATGNHGVSARLKRLLRSLLRRVADAKALLRRKSNTAAPLPAKAMAAESISRTPVDASAPEQTVPHEVATPPHAEAAPAAQATSRLRALLSHQTTLIVAGLVAAPLASAGLAYSFLRYAPADSHAAAATHESGSAHAPDKTPSAQEHSGKLTGTAQPAEPPHTQPQPETADPAGAHAAPHAQTSADGGPAHAAEPLTEKQLIEKQAAALQETQRLLVEEQAKRAQAETALKSIKAQDAPRTAGDTAAKPKTRVARRNLEDCKLDRGTFAQTLKACIEEFNRR
jgi:hypothetical protein